MQVRILYELIVCCGFWKAYNEPIKQDKELKKISDLDIMKIRKKK